MGPKKKIKLNEVYKSFLLQKISFSKIFLKMNYIEMYLKKLGTVHQKTYENFVKMNVLKQNI